MPAYSGESIIKVDKTSFVVSANTNMFAANIAPLATSTTELIIYIVPHLAGILSVFRTTSGTATTVKEQQGNPLTGTVTLGADTAFELTVRIGPNDTINLQYSASDTLTKLMILEIP